MEALRSLLPRLISGAASNLQVVVPLSAWAGCASGRAWQLHLRSLHALLAGAPVAPSCLDPAAPPPGSCLGWEQPRTVRPADRGAAVRARALTYERG